jgi:hypothetical protein
MSSFAGEGIFDSGPHRFRRLPLGLQVVPLMALDGISPGSVALGPLELIVEVRGRLIAPTTAALEAQVDTIGSLLTYPPTQGDLVDHHGRVYEKISFVRFEPDDRTDRGRTVSLAYTARFVRFLSDK